MRGGKLHSLLGERILDKSLWRPTRDSIARAWLVGFPITIVPFLPFQTLFACIAALFVRGNLLLCIALQFLSTPLTAPVHLPACFFAGELVRGRDLAEVWRHIAAAPRDLVTGDAAVSLYLGSIVLGALGGALGYAIILRTWRPIARSEGTAPGLPVGGKARPGSETRSGKKAPDTPGGPKQGPAARRSGDTVFPGEGV